MKQNKQRPNWLLRILLFVSLGIHLIIGAKISGLYIADSLSYIELELKDIAKPLVREIPRPRRRPKSPPMPENTNILKLKQIQHHLHIPQKIEHPDEPDSDIVENIPKNGIEKNILDSGIEENIPIPEMFPGSASTNQQQPEVYADETETFQTAKSYLEMVKLRIEQHKKYPDKAQKRQIEGRVPVSFVITLEGNIRDLKVIKPKQPLLDEAALEAIRNAAPFPRPPVKIFKGAVPLQVIVVFELT